MFLLNMFVFFLFLFGYQFTVVQTHDDVELDVGVQSAWHKTPHNHATLMEMASHISIQDRTAEILLHKTRVDFNPM